jgi:hypothetical protein
MTSTPRLPPIQETFVSTAKSTQPVQVDTSHIGIADAGVTDHFFHEKTYFLTYTTVHGKFMMMANGASILVLGMDTVSLTINGIPVKLIHCYHTPGLRASIYYIRRHRRTHGCSFISNHNGMYLTFGRVFTRVQDEIYCRIQLHPMTYHPSIKYNLEHAVHPLQAPSPVPSVQPPPKHPMPPIQATSLQHPVTYCIPKPKSDPSQYVPPAGSPSNRFQPIAPPKPTPKDYPVTGSPAIRRLTDFEVHSLQRIPSPP